MSNHTQSIVPALSKVFIKSLLPVLFLILIKNTTFAQVSNQGTLTRMSEEEIQLQDKFMAAIVQQQIGKMEGAAKLFEEVLEKNPKCDGCAFQLSRVYATMKDNARSLEYAKKAAAIDPKNKWYKMSLAEAYERIGKDKDAAEVYKNVAEENLFNNDYVNEIYFRWSYCLLRTSEPAKAIKVLDELEKKIGLNETVTEKKHTIYDAAGDTKKAAAELRRLADKYPSVIDYQHLAADYYNKIGDKASAQDLYKRILNYDPNDSKAQMALAVIPANKPSNANSKSDVAFLQSLKEVFKKPDIKIDDKIKSILPQVNTIASKRDKALAAAGLELAQILEQAHPTEAKAFALHGDMLVSNDKPVEALAKYRQCIQINKAVYSVWEQMMYIYDELGQFDELLKTSEQAIDLFPNQANAFIFNGTAYEKKGRLPEAITSLEQAVMMTTKKPELRQFALTELGVVYAKSKMTDKADKAFDEALKLNNKSAITLIRYAYALQLRGENDRAKNMAEEAIKITMEAEPNVLELYGDFLFKANEKEKALQYWQKARERGNRSAILEKKISDKNLVEY